MKCVFLVKVRTDMYRNTENFRIAILFFHGNLNMDPHKRE